MSSVTQLIVLDDWYSHPSRLLCCINLPRVYRKNERFHHAVADDYPLIMTICSKIDDGGTIARKSSSELKQDTKLVNLLRNAVEASSDESGWAHLGSVGSNIVKQSSEFDSRNYGYRKLGELVSATRLFDMEERQIRGNGSKALYIQDKRRNYAKERHSGGSSL